MREGVIAGTEVYCVGVLRARNRAACDFVHDPKGAKGLRGRRGGGLAGEEGVAKDIWG